MHFNCKMIKTALIFFYTRDHSNPFTIDGKNKDVIRRGKQWMSKWMDDWSHGESNLDTQTKNHIYNELKK